MASYSVDENSDETRELTEQEIQNIKKTFVFPLSGVIDLQQQYETLSKQFSNVDDYILLIHKSYESMLTEHIEIQATDTYEEVDLTLQLYWYYDKEQKKKILPVITLFYQTMLGVYTESEETHKKYTYLHALSLAIYTMLDSGI